MDNTFETSIAHQTKINTARVVGSQDRLRPLLLYYLLKFISIGYSMRMLWRSFTISSYKYHGMATIIGYYIYNKIITRNYAVEI